MPKFSVIVPIYNVEQYLQECVDSVLAQTFRDFELILVDDGSPDNCGMICDEYARRDSRIQVIHKKNGGLSDARNAGLDVASGDYVFFLDSDDIVSPLLLEKTLSEMKNNMDMVVFRLQYFYPDGRVEPGNTLECHRYIMETQEERLSFFQTTLLPCKIGWSACTRVFRRDLIEQYHLRFADNKKIFAEDLFFSLCYCVHISRISCIEDCLYHYRQRDDSIMGVQIKNSNIGRINELGKAVLDHYKLFDECKLFFENFAQIHYQIIVGQFIYQLWASGMYPLEFWKKTRESVEDWDFLDAQIKTAMKDPKMMKAIGSLSYGLELRCHAQFMLEGSWIKLRIQCKLIRMFHTLIDAAGKMVNQETKRNWWRGDY